MASNDRFPTTTKTRVALGELLSQGIAASGRSPADISRALGVSAATVSLWRSGDREVVPEALLFVARLLPPAAQARLIEAAAASLLGLDVRVEVAPAQLGDQSPVALVAEIAERSATSIRSVLAAVEDGRIDEDEAARLRRDAAALRDVAGGLDALAAQAVVPGRASRP